MRKLLEKSGFFTITDTANACGITPRMLRHYEKLGLFTPHHIDTATSYRYYSMAEIDMIILIITLKSSGMSLMEIKNYLDGELTAAEQKEKLCKQREAIDRSIEIMSAFTTKAGALAVTRIELPKRVCVCKSSYVVNIEEAVSLFYGFFTDVMLRKLTLSETYPNFCEFPNVNIHDDSIPTSNFIMTVCVPISEKKLPNDAVIYPASEAIQVYYRGDYNNIGLAYERLIAYMEENQLAPNGNAQEIYLVGSTANDSSSQLTSVILPVTAKQTQKRLDKS